MCFQWSEQKITKPPRRESAQDCSASFNQSSDLKASAGLILPIMFSPYRDISSQSCASTKKKQTKKNEKKEEDKEAGEGEGERDGEGEGNGEEEQEEEQEEADEEEAEETEEVEEQEEEAKEE